MVSHDRYFINRVANRIVYLQNKQFIMEKGNYEDFSKLHDITNNAFTFALKKEDKETIKKEVVKKDTSNKQIAKEKAKIEKEIENKMLKLEELNLLINDETQEYNWVEYKKLADEIKEIEEEIEILMLKLDSFN